MAGLLEQVKEYAREQRLWQPGATLVVAVSGGPDSLCLLHLLARLAPEQALVLHVAHLDHGLRPDSAEDARFVAAIAAALSVPVTIARRDVLPYVRHYGGVEAAARAVRYGFLHEVAAASGAAAVATGHNADDQAETVLQRLLRGAGPTGLAAMRPHLPFDHWRGIGSEVGDLRAPATQAPALVRPLLATSRQAIEAYCREQALDPRRDPTNQSGEYLRNRVRGYIIPHLKTYNSNIVAALGRTARICAEEDALLVELLDQHWPMLAGVSEGRVSLARERFGSLHGALRRRAMRRAVALLAPTVELGAEHLDRMLRLSERPRGRLQLPAGLWMRVDKSIITVERTAPE